MPPPLPWRLAACIVLASTLVLMVLLPTTSATGIVNGYCNGGSNASTLACSFQTLQSTTPIINSLSIASYHLSSAGLIQPCSLHTPTCPFPGDVEQFNARVVKEIPGMAEVVPLVFDNDGNTISSIRAMWGNDGYEKLNIDTLVNVTLFYNYTGLSIDWEPSCWLHKPSLCTWPSLAEARRYTGFIARLSEAFSGVDRVLTVCADHEVCEYDCGGDGYLKQCAADVWSMAQCNCCAFQTWYVTYRTAQLSHRQRTMFSLRLLACGMDGVGQSVLTNSCVRWYGLALWCCCCCVQVQC